MKVRSASRALRIAVALAATSGIVACATTPPYRAPAERLADDAVAARVETALLRDPRIFARHIDVEADRGVVRLSGLVWSEDDFYEARRVALSVPGVTTVVSQLELVRGGRSGR